MKVHVLCVVVAVLGSVRCQVPGPCCFPPQMEGQVDTYVGSSGDDGNDATLSIQNTDLFYDYTNKRVAMRTNVTINGNTTHSLTLYLYNKEKVYSVNYDTGRCAVSHLVGSMDAYCVPSSAKKEGDSYLGSKGNTPLPVTQFSFRSSTSAGRISVTSQCVPVSEILYGDGYLATATVRNVVLNITQPDVFNVPSICQQATTSMTKDEQQLPGVIIM